jgi:UDP-N-acetylenolpyruvoylglucosamine reductase
MRKHDREIFFKMIRGKVGFNELLRRHTTIRIGGPAEVWIEPADLIELRLIVHYANDNQIPYFTIGNGSNLLVSDRGVRGFVIRLSSDDFKKIQLVEDTLVVGSGVNVSYLVEQMKEIGMSGLEPLVGIPGTVGGAVCMNAGTEGHWIGNIVRGVSLMDRDGSIGAKDREDLQFRYRGCDGLGDSIILDVVFGLTPEKSEVIARRMEMFLQKRAQSQPQGASAGCIFKNPPVCAAGSIIDRLGFKGHRQGGAVVSDMHANYIVNDNEATADDVLSLIQKIKARALEAEGIVLEPEVKIVGEEVYATA